MVPGVSIRRMFDLQDPALGGAHFDYADCFEMSADTPEERSMESLARAALQGGPLALRVAILVAHRLVLRFRLGPLSSADHVLGWRIVTSAPDHVVLEADGPLMRGVLVGRKTGPRVTVLRTFVMYRLALTPFGGHLVSEDVHHGKTASGVHS